MKKTAILGFLLLSSLAFGQDQKNNQLTIGGGASFNTPTYKSKSKVDPLPIVFYNYKDFYIHNSLIGYNIPITEKVVLSPFVDLLGGPNNIKDKDMNSGYRGIHDRKQQIEYGAALVYTPTDRLTITNKVSTTKYGSSGKTEIEYEQPISEKLTFTPKITSTISSKGLNNYYYGVSQKEAQDSKNYKINKDYSFNKLQFSYGIGGDLNYSFNDHSQLILNFGITKMSEKVENSPIVNNKVNKSVGVAYTYSFIY